MKILNSDFLKIEPIGVMTNKKNSFSSPDSLSEKDEFILRHRIKIALGEHQIEDMEEAMSRHYEWNSRKWKMIIGIAAPPLFLTLISQVTSNF